MHPSRVVALSFLLLPLAGRPAAPADCNGNGIEDFQEVASGRTPDCDANRVPDECDILPVNYGPASRQGVPFPGSPEDLLAGDFDKDGLQDLALLHSGLPPRSEVSIFRNDGLGGLGEGRIHALNDGFGRLTAADIDADGDTDLVATGGSAGGSLASLLPNSGDGTFASLRSLDLVRGIVSVAFADFDRDGDLDLAAAVSFRLVCMQNDGGVFTEAQSLGVGPDPTLVITTDLDGDGDVDLATGNVFENVSLFLNDGDGLFEAGRNYGTGGSVRSLLAADLDADGDADLAAGSVTGVSVLLNRGDASFTTPSRLTPGADVTEMTIGDLDGDGDGDMAAAADGSLAFVPNHGGGAFGPGRAPGQFRIQGLEAVDLYSDGTPELVTYSLEVNSLTILEKGSRRNSPDCNSDGVPDVCQLLENDCNSNSIPDDCDITAGESDCNSNGLPDECEEDCNQNGIPDECDISRDSSADCNTNGVLDECDIESRLNLASPQVVDRFSMHQFLEIADIDQDADQDLIAVVSQANGAIRVFLNGGTGTFEALPDQPASAVSAFQLGDLDRDGDPDLILHGLSRTILGLLNDGRGGFPDVARADLDGDLRAAAGGDLDGDGDLEVVAAIGTGRVLVFSLTQTGTLIGLGPGFETGGDVHALLVSDLDSDGDPDLAVSMLQENLLRTFLNDGRGLFERWNDSRVDRPGDPTITADVTGDGLPDLVQASPVRFRRNRADGSFEAARDILFDMPSPVLAAADLDGDGRIDLGVGTMLTDSCGPTSMVSVFLGDGAGGFTPIKGPRIEGMSSPSVVRSGDLDGDGAPDLAILTRPECHCCEGPTQTGIFTVLNRTSPASSPDVNRNRVPDECEGPSFHRGDTVPDGTMDMTDAISILFHLFRGGLAPPCREAADAQNDGTIDIADAVYILDALFLGGPLPASPGPGPAPCGPDPDAPGSERHLGCETYEACGGR